MNNSKEYKKYCLVMAGGKGTRLWPESSSQKPKQYLSLLDGESLLLNTLRRFEKLVDIENRFVVTLKDQARLADLASKGLIKRDALILEPNGQNTGPCIFLAIVNLLAKGAKESDVVAIVPADHAIGDVENYKKVIESAYEMASEENRIITIGIRPDSPQTGFGYIERGNKLENNFYTVKAFKEKPDLKTAQNYVNSGEYYWNAGMFVASMGTFINEFKLHAPEIFKYFDELRENIKNPNELKTSYEKIPSISFDYAVCEKSQNILVLPAFFQWNDLGSWQALETIACKDQENFWVHNANSDEDYFVKDAKGNIVYAPNQFVALYGVNDLVIVSNKNVLLIVPKNESEKVKDIVAALSKNPKTENLI